MPSQRKRLSREIEDRLEEDEAVLLADGFEDAVVGIVRRPGQPPFVVYDRNACIEILIRDGMDLEEAEEYFEYNVESAWMGETSPGFLYSVKIVGDPSGEVN